MSKCVNENYSNDPTNSINPIIISCDGDMACSKKCEEEYRKQVDAFYAPGGPANSSKSFISWMDK